MRFEPTTLRRVVGSNPIWGSDFSVLLWLILYISLYFLYKGVQAVTEVYKRLQKVTRGYRGIQRVTKGYERLDEITEEYKGVTRGYRGLDLSLIHI